ncbi:MAG TPA: transketolase C-terminal domain-containing protein [Anaerolineae bacterium]|nr:transketolase C-terminal domain-containing protein [Anaerolineae bacterium]
MRDTFARTLAELAEHDPRILLLTGDLGFMALEPFSTKFPERFFNVGVAEQNMVGVATGLAEAGFIPFVYSIVTFASVRPYEFIRNGPVLHRFPVRIVGVGAGVEYGSNGPSHYGVEDLGLMRMQPGLTVVAPADSQQTRTALCATWDLPGPVYYRLGKDDKTIVPGLDGRFELGRAQMIREGIDLAFITTGSITNQAVAAANQLAQDGISAAVMVVASFNPSPNNDLIELLGRVPLVLTVEAHYTVGGIGSYVSEVATENGLPCRIIRCGIQEPFAGISGSTRYIEQRNGLSAEALAHTARHAFHSLPTPIRESL